MSVYQYKGSWPEISNQDYVLDISLTAIYNKALTQFPLWHRVEAGRINCLRWDDEEQLWVRNFKRGLVSSFQQDSSRPETWEVSDNGEPVQWTGLVL